MKRVFFFTTFFYCCIFIYAQVPQGFNYQAIARKSDGKEITNANLQVKISVLSDTTGFYSSGAGIYVWEEQQSITTNSLGLFSLVLGNLSASKIQGTAASFSAIDWKTQQLFIGTKIYYQNEWKVMGSAKLWSVPYAMVSGDFAGPVNKLSVGGSTSAMDEALFEVKNRTGQTVFAVYSEGVRIFVDDGLAKGQGKGGFAIGGFGTAKGASQPYFIVDPDSIRAYTDNNPVKAKKGGFAIGGFDKAKAGTDNFLDLTPLNYFIGHQSGSSITTGMYNSFLGYQTGVLNSSGEKNIFIGYQSGRDNITASYNVFLGNETGISNQGNYNTFLGFQSGFSNTLGSSNCFIGKMSGKFNTNGTNNVFIGFESGFNNTGGAAAFQGSNNTFLGSNAGHQNTLGWSNVFIGTGAGYKTTDGYRNIFLGVGAGYENLGGSDNIYFGNDAGHYNTAGNSNIFLGAVAGYHNQTGSENIFFGTWAGGFNTSGSNNICIGRQTGMQNNGSDNVYIGPLAGMYNTVGINNLYLGSSAGGINTLGSGNVFLGYHAGYNEKGSNKLYIANSDVDSTLIFGDFSSKIVGIGTSHPLANLEVAVSGTNGYAGIGIKSSLSGGRLITINQAQAGKLNFTVPGVFDLVTFDYNTYRVGIGTTAPGYTLHINGTVAGTSAYANLSDERYKKDIFPITGALSKVMELQGITFQWDYRSYPDLNLDNRNHFGFSAQDIEKVLPQVVTTADDRIKTKSVTYSDIVPVLVEAIKEQQQQIESCKSENENLKSKLESLQEKVEQIEDLLAKSGLK